MNAKVEFSHSRLVEMRDQILNLSPKIRRNDLREAARRMEGMLAAVLYHFEMPSRALPTVFLGGTGTGKSTLLNRLLGVEVSTVSFRRTYTNGAVAVVSPQADLPENWLGVPHRDVDELPVRGEAGSLTIIRQDHPLLERTILVDTPDLDGEREEHHAEADRGFRWANRVLFLVTPEKYQMTELPPYYRLAARYGLPALFLMNKCEEPEVLEDYKARLADWGWPEAKVYAIPRDDSGFQPLKGTGLEDFRKEVVSSENSVSSASFSGLAQRCRDAVGRVRDQILDSLRGDRKSAEKLLDSLNGLSRSSPDVDVSPITERLEARMREKSILYLIGPSRIADRMKNLYRNLFPGASRETGVELQAAPDFWQILVDQLVTAQSQFDDLVRSDSAGVQWIESDPDSYAELKLDPAEAGRIAEREIEALGAWLAERWDTNPRDTTAIEKLLRRLPGAERFTKWTEAAPYLLVLVCVGSRAFLGPLDLLVIGGYSLTAWLGEKLSNEVTAKVRQTNRRICQEYVELFNRQADLFREWIEARIPSTLEIDQLETALERFEDSLEEWERKHS